LKAMQARREVQRGTLGSMFPFQLYLTLGT
jgi:hypothetical protein